MEGKSYKLDGPELAENIIYNEHSMQYPIWNGKEPCGDGPHYSASDRCSPIHVHSPPIHYMVAKKTNNVHVKVAFIRVMHTKEPSTKTVGVHTMTKNVIASNKIEHHISVVTYSVQ